MSEKYHQQSVYSVFIIQLALAVFLMIALLNGRRDLVLLTLLMLVIMTSARWWSCVSLNRLRIEIRTDRSKLFPGEELQVGVRVENQKWLPVCFRLEMFFAGGLQPTEEDTTRECGLLWHQGTEFQWKLRTLQRGVYRLGSAQITAGDFFGFYLRARKLERAPVEIVVYPRIRPVRTPAYPAKNFFGQPGARSPVQDPIYILGTRDYHHWQPARYIHWKASARHDRLQEKVFEPSSQAKILFLLDAASFARHEAGADFERAIEVAASTALQCHRKGHALGFLTNATVEGGTNRVAVSHSPHKLSDILEILARLKMQTVGALAESLRRGAPMPWGVSAVCFSYEIDEETRAVEILCKLRRIPVIFLLCRQAPGTGNAAMTLDEMAVEAVPT
ncbi:MAG: DUF58 domain-containing protein [Desulfobacteraceae bacterium]|nr:MAG: DUF58 domain-containing protein [Desulfobacteraceae bacterium]